MEEIEDDSIPMAQNGDLASGSSHGFWWILPLAVVLAAMAGIFLVLILRRRKESEEKGM